MSALDNGSPDLLARPGGSRRAKLNSTIRALEIRQAHKQAGAGERQAGCFGYWRSGDGYSPAAAYRGKCLVPGSRGGILPEGGAE